MSFNLFEVSWEVANKVGGIYTVVSSKARELCREHGDRYVCIGPWLHGQESHTRPFEEEPGHEAFVTACAARGLSVRVGRWQVPGRPLTLLIGFSKLFEDKDAILASLWEDHGVDSLMGGWDYVEPVTFGHAAALTIAEWIEHEAAPGRSVAQFHEWMTGAGLLHCKAHLPHVATIFTTHATMLGRALSGTGLPPAEALGDRTPEQLAEQIGVRAKHSMEGAAARAADVFTTVSAITAAEAELLHRRQAQPLLPNGLDLELLDELSAAAADGSARDRMVELASCMCGEDLREAKLLCISGRYEMHNKGIDVLLDGLAAMNAQAGPQVVAFVTVPAGVSGPRRKVRECLLGGDPDRVGISSHELIDRDNDPVQRKAEQLGLLNASGSRVKLIQVPIYLDGTDSLLPLQYEAALRACDLSVFPSFYEPWGYTPAESVGVGVPTITTDCAGFGVWARESGIGAEGGVTVLNRVGKSDTTFTGELVSAIEAELARPGGAAALRGACLASAEKVAWTGLVEHYNEAFARAIEAAADRPDRAPKRTLTTRRVAPRPASTAPRLTGFEVEARLPAALEPLERLAWNLWWSWDSDAQTLFRDISPEMWEACGYNPVLFLRRAYPRDLEAKAAEPDYVARVSAAAARFDEYMGSAKGELELSNGSRISRDRGIAYFCFEFGVHESVRIYSGGLGLLAGDHLKSASDLDLPFVGVGLFYRGGYVQQRISPTGEQLSLEAPNDPSNLPLELVRDETGAPIEIEIPLYESSARLRVFKLQVGRVPLYLLDADHEGNAPAERALTNRLYGGDNEHRLRQEIVLGRGGVRLLDALGLEPTVLHLNEGHAAFAGLERAAKLIHRENLTFDEAAEVVRASSAFTTHTPVPAGHDRFDEDLLRRYFADTAGWVGLDWERFMSLGQDQRRLPEFNMTFLASNLAGFINGVAEKHGEVSRELLQSFWPSLLVDEVPVDHVTNGVHLPTWTRPSLQRLLGVEGRLITGQDFVDGASEIDRRALWAERQAAKRDLLARCAKVLTESFHSRQDSPRLLAQMLEGLREDALVIGFARRFAPYKRANLLFKDPDRLERLLSDADRPVVFLFSGKAHPADGGGKDLLKEIVSIARSERFRGRVFFIEDYDIGFARYLKQGVDVWLNNPIRPLEASGTSGMKVAANGSPNLSILDGWWIEGFDGSNGWAIGDLEKTYPNQELQDQFDNEHLLRLLEEEVVPQYFERDAEGLPQAWLERMVRVLATCPQFFCTNRMVGQYTQKAYAPLAVAAQSLTRDGFRGASRIAENHARIAAGFQRVAFVETRTSDLRAARSGDHLEVEVRVALGDLRPEEVVVEAVWGHGNGNAAAVHDMQSLALAAGEASEEGVHEFRGSGTIGASGGYRFGIRVRPRREGPWDLALAGLCVWA